MNLHDHLVLKGILRNAGPSVIEGKRSIQDCGSNSDSSTFLQDILTMECLGSNVLALKVLQNAKGLCEGFPRISFTD